MLLFLLSSSIIFAQEENNSLTITLGEPKIPENFKLNIENEIRLIIDCSDSQDLKLVVTELESQEGIYVIDCSCKVEEKIKLEKSIATKWIIKENNEQSYAFKIDKNGNVSKYEEKSDAKTVNIPLSKTVFVKTDFVIPDYLDKQNRNKSIIKYDVCNNKFIIYNGDSDTDKNYLIYSVLGSKNKSKKNEGVIFLIEDINTLKYDINVDKSENTFNTELPELFNVIEGLVGGTKAISSDSKDSVKLKEFYVYIGAIGKLNNDLSKYLNSESTLKSHRMTNYSKIVKYRNLYIN